MELELSYRPYRRAFRRPLQTAHGKWTHREGFILRLAGGGRQAYGEVAPLPEFGTETVEEAGAVLAGLVGSPGAEAPVVCPCCRFALSVAKQCLTGGDALVASAHGGSASGIEAPRPLAGLLPGGAAALEAVGGKLAAGYRCLKWKIGLLPVEEEIALGAQLLRALPAGVKLRLDGNGGLSPDALERWLDFLVARSGQIEFVEQPLPPGAEATMAAMSASWGVPIALDESLNGSGGRQWFKPGAWTGPLVIKPLLMGELSALEPLLRPRAGALVYSSVFETVFGLRQALTLVHLLPTSPYALGFDTAAAFDDALSPGFAGPRLDIAQLSRIDLDQRWNRLPHLI